MPLKLIPPSPERRTPYYAVRGSHLGISLYRSTKTGDLRAAKKILAGWKADIERGAYRRDTIARETTFADAAISYMNAGGERRYLRPAIEALGRLELSAITQADIDAGAVTAFPNGSAAYRNRNFYTPVSAVMKHAGVERSIKRPKGWRGKRTTTWLEPEQAFALLKAADAVDVEFGLWLRVLLYTGMRLSESLAVRLRDVSLKDSRIWLRDTKNGHERPAYLPPPLVAALANHPRGLDRATSEKLFRFSVNGRTRALLQTAKQKAGLSFPARHGGFHIFCHTWATWMRRYGGLDTFDLVETERWRDPASARRYAHIEPGNMARRADLLPVEKRRRR